MTADSEVELIEIRFPTLNKTAQLSREASAKIWEAVKRGEAGSAEEYVNQALERVLAKHSQETSDRGSRMLAGNSLPSTPE